MAHFVQVERGLCESILSQCSFHGELSAGKEPIFSKAWEYAAIVAVSPRPWVDIPREEVYPHDGCGPCYQNLLKSGME